MTAHPSAAAIDAYSSPIAPAPTIVSVAGMPGSRWNPSQSSTVRPSKSNPGGRAGAAPTAITKCSADARWLARAQRISSVCGSANAAVPGSTSTRLRRNSSAIASCSCSTTCSVLHDRSSIVISPLRAPAVSLTTAARSVCGRTAAAPPSAPSRSTIAARFPSLDASIAARRPAGPEPIAIRS